MVAFKDMRVGWGAVGQINETEIVLKHVIADQIETRSHTTGVRKLISSQLYQLIESTVTVCLTVYFKH